MNMRVNLGAVNDKIRLPDVCYTYEQFVLCLLL